MVAKPQDQHETIVKAIKAFTGIFDNRLKDILEKLGGGTDGPSPENAWEIPDDAKSAEEEEVLIRYTQGKGKFDAHRRYNYLKMNMFQMDGTLDGSHDGVWEPQFMPDQLYEVPPDPRGPLNKPEGPVDPIPIRAWTKAIWYFGSHKRDSVTAVGPANLLLVPLEGDRTIFLVSVAAIITSGRGKYDGARGVKTALGSTLVEGNWENLFNLPPGHEFDACTIETFRIITSDNIGEYPS